jgi:hypothetical protein
MSDPPDEPDVEISAWAKARELTFNKPPRTHVETFAGPSGRSGSASSRRNLPDPVEADVPYQDVEADYKAGAKLAGTEDAQPPAPESGESQRNKKLLNRVLSHAASRMRPS